MKRGNDISVFSIYGFNEIAIREKCAGIEIFTMEVILLCIKPRIQNSSGRTSDKTADPNSWL
jgi:hypothetical protein